MKRLVVVIALTALCFATWHTSTFAWGAAGHRIVARLALGQLTPTTRKAAESLLGNENFITSANWADQVRPNRPTTANWHFVDIPVGAGRYDAARDCPADPQRGDCLIAALERLQRDLRDTSLPRVRRREALKFLIHFVGDLHQPLHCADNHDRGGNSVNTRLAGVGPMKLHAVWDSGVIGARGMDELAYVAFLVANAPAAGVHPIDVVAWAEEAHQVAVSKAYTYPGFVIGQVPTATVALSATYRLEAQQVVDLQLQRAGARLAAILNAAF